LGGSLEGVDLSPDGNTLAVADATTDGVNEWVYLVNLNTLVGTKVTVPIPSGSSPFSYEAGTFALAFGSDGSLIVTSVESPTVTGGYMALQRLIPSTGQWSSLAYNGVEEKSMVSASGDGQTIAVSNGGTLDGSWGAYYIPFNQYAEVDVNTYEYNYETATNAHGDQFALQTSNGTFIFDSAHNLVTTIGASEDNRPIGVAYHPVENEMFLPWEGTSQVRVYDATTFTELGSYDFEDTFAPNPQYAEYAFAQGRTRLSPDGSLLMVSVTGGVRFLRMYSPLAAKEFAAHSSGPGASISMRLEGSIGNNGTLSYSLGKPPMHGNVTISGNIATYTPGENYHGQDHFTYQVNYGRATKIGNVVITTIIPKRDPPRILAR
jgi:DNA-binding beta-propeller fold protein YncE